MTKFKLPEEYCYKEVKTGNVTSNPDGTKKEETVKVKLNRRERKYREKLVEADIRKRRENLRKRDAIIEGQIIGKNDILNAIVQEQPQLVGNGLTKTAEEFCKKSGYTVLYDTVNNKVCVQIQSINDTINQYQILDESGNNVVEDARKEVENEVEDILKGQEELLKFPRIADDKGRIADFVDCKDGEVTYLIRGLKRNKKMNQKDWMALPLEKPEGAEELLNKLNITKHE